MTGVLAQDVGVTLLRISPAGAAISTTIFAEHCERGFSNYTTCMNPPNLGELVPDGIGGILVTFGHTIAAINDHTFTMEARLTRVTPAGIQYDVLHEDSAIRLTVAGVAFVNDSTGGVESGVRAVDVADWTTIWSITSPSLSPVTALPDGGVALFDSATNQITAYSATGVAGQSGVFDWYWGYLGNQTAFGLWTGGQGPTGGQLTAHISLPIYESNAFYTNRGGEGPQQNAPQRRPGLDSVADAALAAFDFFELQTRSTPWEWGGVICATGTGKFTYSRIVTNNDAGSVRTLDSYGLTPEQVAALPTCAPYGIDSPVGSFHMHTPDGQTEPSGYADGAITSGSDLDNAATRPDITFFVLTSNISRTGTVRFMYQGQQVPQDGGGFTWSAFNNTFRLVNGQWTHHNYQQQ